MGAGGGGDPIFSTATNVYRFDEHFGYAEHTSCVDMYIPLVQYVPNVPPYEVSPQPAVIHLS